MPRAKKSGLTPKWRALVAHALHPTGEVNKLIPTLNVGTNKRQRDGPRLHAAKRASQTAAIATFFT